MTRHELGGSLWAEVHGQERRPRAPGRSRAGPRPASVPSTRRSRRGLVRSCHDLSEGGLAVALAEMAFAGGLGARVSLADVPRDADAASDLVLLFSESPTRFVLEVRPECCGELAERPGRSAARPARRGDRRRRRRDPAPPRLTVRGLDGLGRDRRLGGRLESRLATAAALVVTRAEAELGYGDGSARMIVSMISR